MSTSPISDYFKSGFFIDVDQFYHHYLKSSSIAPQLVKLPRCQELITTFSGIVAKYPDKYPNRYFISHRWDDEDDPDIRRWQLKALFHFASELKMKKKTPACFWYDYCSLPQKPRTVDEERLFDIGLKELNDLCRTTTNIPLISYSDPDGNIGIKNMLRRGWILVELIIAEHHNKIYLPLFENSNHVTFSKVHRLNWQDTIRKILDVIPFYDPVLIRKWFDVNKIECTNGSDLTLVANLLHKNIYAYVKSETITRPPALKVNQPVILNSSEVLDYKIDRYGLSALFPDLFFNYASTGGRQYTVTPVERPKLPALDQPHFLNEGEYEKFSISSVDGSSKLYPGIQFQVTETGKSYRIVPTIGKVDWNKI